MGCMWLQVGAHDGDWEHVTVQLSADASRVLGVYYSAHRSAQHPALIMCLKYESPVLLCCSGKIAVPPCWQQTASAACKVSKRAMMHPPFACSASVAPRETCTKTGTLQGPHLPLICL